MKNCINNFNMILLYVPCPSKEEAKKIARDLLKKHLIGCANIFPIESMYWDNDAIMENDEFVLIVKTTEQLSIPVHTEIVNLHPYDIPCIAKIDTEVNDAYLHWIVDACKTADY